jgi:D-arginine dehydrogenase
LDAAFEEARQTVSSVQRLDQAQTLAQVPVLRADKVAGGVLEPEAKDIDVASVHHGYLRGVKARGGDLIVDAGVEALTYGKGKWEIDTPAGIFAAPIVVNAAGAWCDQVGEMAGLARIGLQPKIRTVIVFDVPTGLAIDAWPLTIGVSEDFYFKPDAGRILGSLADETPSPPCDILPDELAVATAADRIQNVADLPIRHIAHKWAGLRSFVADRTPVVGFDPAADGFFWLAGQGGYGIQTSPAMGRTAAALVAGGDLPADIAALGVQTADLAPDRLLRGEGVV